jgi:hypothetical protein
MKKNAIILCGIAFFGANSFAEAYTYDQVAKLHNDKEVKITRFSAKAKENVLKKYEASELRTKIGSLFYEVVYAFVNDSNLRCEINLIERLKNKLKQNDFNYSYLDIEEYLKLLRSTQYIDDIFYEFLSEINTDFYELNKIDRKLYQLGPDVVRGWTKNGGENFNRRDVTAYKKLTPENDVEDLYENFSIWPDDKKSCLYQQLNYIRGNLKDYKNKGRKISKKRNSEILKQLNRAAVINKSITANSFMKLEYLREKSFVTDRYLSLENYLLIVFNNKNHLKPENYTYNIQDIEKEFDFSSVVLSRYNSLTRRKDLYEKYNGTQITSLSQVLEKASKRMGVDPDYVSSRVVVTQTFQRIKSDGTLENYVEEERLELSPGDQYTFSRKRMRQDIENLKKMKEYADIEIYYSDVVMAALETGYLSLEDIEYAVKYDDLWNPEKTEYEKILGYIFSFTGYATFFLPPPYNVTASIGLVVIQNVLYNRQVKGELNDNSASFID